MIARALSLAVVVPALVAVPGPAVAAVTCQGVTATIVGTPGADVLTGTPGRDVIAGLGGDDVLRGLGGSDLLCGGAGDDELYGGADRRWHDQFQTIGTGDRLDGGWGDDLLHPGPRIRGVELVQPDLIVFPTANGVRVDLRRKVAVGQGHDTIVRTRTLGVVGSPGDDTLIGSALPDRLTGKGGDDVIRGNGGRDTIYADDGDDDVDGGPDADEITSSGGQDTVRGRGGDDVISMRGGGADEVHAGAGGDLVFLWPGHPRVFAGSVLDAGTPGPQEWDTDNLYFSSRNPWRGVRFALDALAGTLVVDGHAGAVTGFAYVNFAIAGTRLDFLGSDGPDELTIEGNARVDADGRGGDDVLYGGPRNDRLIGGDGRDFVVGAGGTDTCDAERMRGCEA